MRAAPLVRGTSPLDPLPRPRRITRARARAYRAANQRPEKNNERDSPRRSCQVRGHNTYARTIHRPAAAAVFPSRPIIIIIIICMSKAYIIGGANSFVLLLLYYYDYYYVVLLLLCCPQRRRALCSRRYTGPPPPTDSEFSEEKKNPV